MESKRARGLAIAVTAATLSAVGIAISIIAGKYLTEYDQSLQIAGVSALVTVIGVIAALRILPRRDSPRASFVLAGLSLTLSLVVLGSIFIGRVTHSHFGFTVYGAIPIPALDITIDSNGLLWFRDKTHRITVDEVRPLLSGSTQLVIIGIGWEERAKIDPAVLELLGDKARVLETKAAFEAFNRARTEGKQVVLLAHTTC